MKPLFVPGLTRQVSPVWSLTISLTSSSLAVLLPYFFAGEVPFKAAALDVLDKFPYFKTDLCLFFYPSGMALKKKKLYLLYFLKFEFLLTSHFLTVFPSVFTIHL